MKTPCLCLDQEKLLRNIKEIAEIAKKNKTILRSHCKSHKTLEIAKAQIKARSQGITASTLKEVKMFLTEGIEKITLVYPLVDKLKIREYKRLTQRAKLRTIIIFVEYGELLRKYFTSTNYLIAYLKVDTDLRRLGILPEEIEATLKELTAFKELRVIGLLAYGGQSYQGKNPLKEIAEEEAYSLINNNPNKLIISRSSTPTIKELLKIKGVNEARPGNYVFYDRIIIALGVANKDTVSLFLVATIIEKKERLSGNRCRQQSLIKRFWSPWQQEYQRLWLNC